jgi:putative spermidine/putrescine transport system ATP-binding protein
MVRSVRLSLAGSRQAEVETAPVPGIDKLMASGLAKSYGPVVALHPTDLNVASGELLTLLGASGSGKTTLLQLICGLVEPTGGRLFIDGADCTALPARKRHMGVVFQNYALFPHMTVEENVGFALDVRKVKGAELQRRVANVLEMVGLGGFGKRFPRELSGGQQQRVALARCFIYEPSLILMDEPLGALDRKLREALQIEIKRLHRQTGATILFVTHDQDEALALSDRICLMNAGRVEQVGTPQEMYEQPKTLLAADFIGISNVLRGKVGHEGNTLNTADGPVPISRSKSHIDAALVVRPEHMVLSDGPGLLRGRVAEAVYAGSETRIIVVLGSGNILTIRRSHGSRNPPIGAIVTVSWAAERARLLPI